MTARTSADDSGGTLDLGKTTRAQAYALLLGGTMTGLPIPQDVFMDNELNIVLDKDDRAGVDAWAVYLGLPAATVRDFGTHASYRSDNFRSDRHPFSVAVRCNVDSVPAADEQAEVSR